MTSSETATGIHALIESYRTAFERLDAAAIADHFVYPCHITGDAEEIALIPMATRQDCIAAVQKVLAMHRQLGAPSGRIHDLSITELSPRLAQASLRMEALDSAARTLYDFESTYTLAKIQGAWRIAAIAHNQIPRLLACLAQHPASG
jgi:ketosteroid isomerase-like protein